MAVQQPGVGGDKFTAAEHNGALLLFFPSAYRTDIPTQHGTSDAVEAKIVNLDTGQVLENAMIFGKALVAQLKGAAATGDEVLGRLGQGQNQKGNPPWMLFSYDENEYARAEQWIAQNSQPKFQQPAPPTQNGYGAPATPAPQPWGGQAAAPAPAQGGWQGQGAPQAPAQAPGQWGGAAPAATPAPAPAATPLDPGLAAALQAKGIPTEGMSHERGLELWAMVGGQ